MRLARRSSQTTELVRFTPVQFSICVGIVVVLLAGAGLVGYVLGGRDAEERLTQVSETTADISPEPEPVPARTDTRSPVTFYTVLTETKGETPPSPTPRKAPAETEEEPAAVDRSGGDLAIFLQVASYKGRESAAGLLEKLSAEGYSGSVQVADLGERGTWYRVRIGPYGSEEEAKRVLDKLRKERDLKGYIVR